MAGRQAQPNIVILGLKTLQSSCEIGTRAVYDGDRRRISSNAHMTVDDMGQLVALTIKPANEQERTEVDKLSQQVHKPQGIQ